MIERNRRAYRHNDLVLIPQTKPRSIAYVLEVHLRRLAWTVFCLLL